MLKWLYVYVYMLCALLKYISIYNHVDNLQQELEQKEKFVIETPKGQFIWILTQVENIK